jgi:hypothetical protein
MHFVSIRVELHARHVCCIAKRFCYIIYGCLIISRSILLRMRNVSDDSCRENQNTIFIFENLLRKSCNLRDNVEEYGTARRSTDDITLRCTRTAFLITKETHTLCNTSYRGNKCYTNVSHCSPYMYIAGLVYKS